MKNKLTIIGLLIGFLSPAASAGEVCKDKLGALKCGPGLVENISYTGFVEMNGTSVLKGFNVWGSAIIVNSKLNIINMKGESTFTDTEINGKANISGKINATALQIKSSSNITGDIYASHVSLEGETNITGSIDCEFCVFESETSISGEIIASSSRFKSLLSLSIKKAEFSNSELGDIQVKKHSKNEEQYIFLKKGSKVQNISFEGQRGLVVLSEGSEVNGQVQGGSIVKN